MSIDISKNWKLYTATEAGIDNAAEETVDLPLDLCRRLGRNYAVPFGKFGGYASPAAAALETVLPYLNKAEWIVLEIEDVCGFADVLLNGQVVAHLSGEGKHYVDISAHYVYAAQNTLTLNVWAPQMAGRYTGAGIGGGVRLHVHGATTAIAPDGVYVVSACENGHAHLRVRTELSDKLPDTRQTLLLEVTLFNARNKRVARKTKKVRVKGDRLLCAEVPFRLSRFYMWTPSDPYMYTAKVSLYTLDGKPIDTAEAPFGIVTRALSGARGLVLCGRGTKLKGAVMPRDNGLLGAESTLRAETYKLSKIKEIGYNAVRYAGVPTEAALSALDSLGLMAQVDLFHSFARGSFPCDGHTAFSATCVDDAARFVRQLRKHPSVVLYGLCDDAEEVYGRGEGAALCAELCGAVKAVDPTRPVVIASGERVPTKAELEQAGLKSARATDKTAAVSMGREKDLFGTLTAPSFACADVAGYAFLYPRYADDRAAFPDRLIVGTAAYPSRAFEAFEECDRNGNVIGEFVCFGADGIGYPYGNEESEGTLPPYTSSCGDLDITYARTPIADYHSVLLGNRGTSAIAVFDPEAARTSEGFATPDVSRVWNWPQHLGKKLQIDVYSGGEVVALYRDGKLVGRRLAGKVNKHTASFSTEFFPGKLEAVSFHKGRECSRVTLESVGSPRALKLRCDNKTGLADDLLFVEIEVCDKEGRLVPFASREIEVQVEGDGKLWALGSAEKTARLYEQGFTKTHEGRALAVIKCTAPTQDGKIAVKVLSDGLLSGKIALRTKEPKETK